MPRWETVWRVEGGLKEGGRGFVVDAVVRWIDVVSMRSRNAI